MSDHSDTGLRTCAPAPQSDGLVTRGAAAAASVLAIFCALLVLCLAGAPVALAAASPALDASLEAARAPQAAPAPVAAWTVMIYMDGDNDLEPWIIHDLEKELGAVGSNADVQVVALADRAAGYTSAAGDWTGTLAFHITKGMRATPEYAVADWGERDMGSPRTLVDFVTWAREAYPARRTALIFWDHGWGWWPGETMKDVTSNDYLDMDELRRALETVGGVDMAGMETCLGQTIEVQAEFRGFAKALAGSEDSTGYTTFSYPEILSRLQAEPTMSAAELAVVAAKSIRTGHDKWSLTGSAVALDRSWDRLAQAVSDLGWDLASRLPAYRDTLGRARGHTASPPQSYSEVRDLYDMAAQIRARVAGKAVRRDCDRVLHWLQRCTLYEWSAPAEGRMHGTAIFWPAGPRRGAVFSQWVDFPYYASQLTFTRLTYWADFLDFWGG